MEMRQLEYFVTVASELNFSRAAQRIHVVQSALSASVAKLEKELGVELFDRSKRQIVLTAPGEVFLQHAREVIHTAQRAQASMADYRDQLTGTVTLGTLMSWGGLNLATVLEEFRRLHPLVTVQLRQSLTGSAGHLEAIADGKMDLALVSLSASPSRLVAVRELTHEPMVFVCKPGHELAGRRHVKLGDLDGQDFIQFPRGWGIRQRLDAGFAAVGVQPTSAYEVADYAIAAELVRHRLAATVLPVSAAERYPDLRGIPLSPPVTWTLYLASAASRTGAVTALVDTISRYIEG
ncbi:LysR family transcriptional regulator [Mycobacterium montefiorense]|uniref:Probable hydrogen peroxide-inducible genes activator n=1 Tax=Mycobacterium montefiorense TaxID=154654 RepID=A0AA37PIG5_9MYCO|nr:LysR family transcriptional regulator [Mycobacterium montefiorense]GBG37331.1 putative transcriptional regulator, LysR family protein [Mycobacterium montefiorense]GKU35831.1 putative transcriptional regulator, LysR family protein [Mycobacterium montefiorense]GKU39796.1 putative transcriptional regulator, LysR family protein [Mycobacterium montefiorense]GKU47670.1 putative transcriptional regulator, LysR family protein [Mycobacterium montefiorense]GKU48864.1 putative transcriptional regulato